MFRFLCAFYQRVGELGSISKMNRIFIITTTTALMLTVILFYALSPTQSRAQDSVESADLAKFVALMQYIRSQPTPSDVKAANIPFLAILDNSLSDIYITGFITPYTGETPEQVKARLQSVPTEDRFTAVMVESYRLTTNPLLLDIVHQLLPLYYVEFFTTAADLNASADFLKREDIESLAGSFDWSDYAIPAPSATPSEQPSLALRYDPAGQDRNCDDFTMWRDAQAFFWATQNDSHGLDPDGDGIACESLPGAPQSEVVIVTPTPPGSGEVRFYDVNDTDEDQESVRQGGMFAIEVEDSDLDVVGKFEGDEAESHMLDNVLTFFLRSVPVADRNDDGFINQRDIIVADANGNRIDVDRAGVDGRVDLVVPHTGEVRVAYWGAVVNNTGFGDDSTVTVKSQADPTGISITLMETGADTGVFRGIVATNGANAGDASDADTSPYPTLKVGKNDVIRVTYSDASPRRTVSATLPVATTTPTPTSSGSDMVRFYDIYDTNDDLEWVRQGGMFAIEVEDSDLDVVGKFEGDEAESHMLDNVLTFFLRSVPIADRNDDGFINQRDIIVADANGNRIDVDRAGVDGRVDLVVPHTGEVRVTYWGAVVNNTGFGDDSKVTVKSQADPTGISITLMETGADTGVFRGIVATNGANAGDESDAASSPYPTLKVGENDVITATYSDASPRRTLSATLTVGTSTPATLSAVAFTSTVTRIVFAPLM